MRMKPEIVLDDQDRPQVTVPLTDAPATDEEAVTENPAGTPAPPESTDDPALPVPRVWDYVYLYGPAGVRLPGIVTAITDGDPPRCRVQGFAANGLCALAGVPVRPVPGDDWWAELVARFEGSA